LDEKRGETNIHWLFSQSQERKEKGQKEREIEVNDHEHTLHSFFFSSPTDTRVYTKVIRTNMSPTCMIKPKQSIYQQKSKPKYIKNKQSKSDISLLWFSCIYDSRAKNRRIHNNDRKQTRDWWTYLYRIRYEMQVYQTYFYIFKIKSFFLLFSCPQSKLNNHPSIQVCYSLTSSYQSILFSFSFLVVIFNVKVQCLLPFFDHIYNNFYHILLSFK
jgi:hypothetical protein